MGMKEWFVPQISEHCPINNPIRLEDIKIWFKRPGIASTFSPIDGMVQEWMTSADVISNRVMVFTGIFIVSLVFKSRRMFEFSIKFSVSVELMEVYSYDQYHWWPVIFIVKFGVLVSSIKYRVFRDGIAIKISRIAGRIVQIVSISWPSIMNLLKLFPIVVDNVRYSVIIVIKIRMIMAWSWKNMICSIVIDEVSCKERAIQIGIIFY